MSEMSEPTSQVQPTAAEAAETARKESRPANGRAMPEAIRKHLVRLPHGQYYLPVAARVAWFRSEHENGALLTRILEQDLVSKTALIQAEVTDSSGRVLASGLRYGSEAELGERWLEKTETGAIGRALAFAGYGLLYAPELQDEDMPPPRSSARSRSLNRASAQDRIWQGPGLCPGCHAPAGKPHARRCTLGVDAKSG